jgi:hypothetical protein
MATAAAALAARARREIQHHFFAADAVRPDRAVAFDPANGFERRQFDRMRAHDIVREEKPGEYWLDVVAYDVALRARHRRVRIALLVVIALLLIALVTSGALVRLDG